MRALAKTLLLTFAVAARAQADEPRRPLAALWLDGPHAGVEAVERGLSTASAVRPLDDPKVRTLFVEGGPSARVARHLAEAHRAMAQALPLAEHPVPLAQACAAAKFPLEAAERIAVVELPVLDERSSLLAIAKARLDCAMRLNDAEEISRLDHIISRFSRFSVGGSAARVRVESEPAGADVFVDFVHIGKTPIDLPAAREPDALVEVELEGFRKVRRESLPAGTWTATLAREDSIAPLVDKIRAANGDANEADVAALGTQVGAAYVLVLRGEQVIQARLFDVATGKWSKPAITVPIADAPARIAGYASPASPVAAPAPAVAAKSSPQAQTQANAAPVPAWKKWYTWAIGGVMVALVVGLVVANHVGSDSITVHASH